MGHKHTQKNHILCIFTQCSNRDVLFEYHRAVVPSGGIPKFKVEFTNTALCKNT